MVSSTPQLAGYISVVLQVAGTGAILVLAPFLYRAIVDFSGHYQREDHFKQKRAQQFDDENRALAEKENFARRAVSDNIKEWHRHTDRNWKVLKQIIDEMAAGAGIPVESHFEKMRYVDKRAMFEHERFFLLDDDLREQVLELEPIIRNVNLEVDEAVRASKTNDMDRITKICGLLHRKFQYLFVNALPKVARGQTVGWVLNDDIVAARQQELRDRDGREDIVYRKP